MDYKRALKHSVQAAGLYGYSVKMQYKDQKDGSVLFSGTLYIPGKEPEDYKLKKGYTDISEG